MEKEGKRRERKGRLVGGGGCRRRSEKERGKGGIGKERKE